jgi:hypothetical protein
MIVLAAAQELFAQFALLSGLQETRPAHEACTLSKPQIIPST